MIAAPHGRCALDGIGKSAGIGRTGEPMCDPCADQKLLSILVLKRFFHLLPVQKMAGFVSASVSYELQNQDNLDFGPMC